jgi:dienelactone hydrolase
VRESSTIELLRGDVVVRESPVRIAQPFGDLYGVLTQPGDASAAHLTAVLLNAGAHRRIGQGRMWVEAARRWAAAGVPTLRLDLEGIGDSDGDGRRFTDMGELYDERLVAQALAAVDALDARGLGPSYVAAGLCSGACWSFHMALRDARVRAALMINPQAIFWHRSLGTARMIRHGSKLKLLRGEVERARLARFARGLPALAAERVRARARALRSGDELERALDVLRDGGKRVEFMFSGGEPLRAELEAQGWPAVAARWPNVSYRIIPGEDHILRPLPAQRFVHGELDRALEAELGRPLRRHANGASADAAQAPGAGVSLEASQPAAGAPGALQVVRMMSTEQGA